MVRLREIPRTATFAWSPGPTQPLIATGTKAGAVDADFSNDTTLELWELNLDSGGQAIELQPVATVNADSRHVPLVAARQPLYLDRVLTCTPDLMT
jgi:protein transport protein SEC31